MKVLVTGDRNWTDEAMIEDRLSYLKVTGYDYLVHGAARGADRIAGKVAKELNFPTIKAYPANWEEFGKAAGSIRNEVMLHKEKPHLVVYFHHDLEKSKGTKHMVGIAKKAKVPVMNGITWQVER